MIRIRVTKNAVRGLELLNFILRFDSMIRSNWRALKQMDNFYTAANAISVNRDLLF